MPVNLPVEIFAAALFFGQFVRRFSRCDVREQAALRLSADDGGLFDIERLQPVVLVIRAFKDGGQPVIVALRQRIVLVRVAVRALHGQAQDGRAKHIDFIGDHVQPVIGEIHFTLAG